MRVFQHESIGNSAEHSESVSFPSDVADHVHRITTNFIERNIFSDICRISVSHSLAFHYRDSSPAAASAVQAAENLMSIVCVPLPSSPAPAVDDAPAQLDLRQPSANCLSMMALEAVAISSIVEGIFGFRMQFFYT